MYDNTKNPASPASEVKPAGESPSLEHHEKRIVREMNKTMNKKPYLKQYFYNFLIDNNDQYEIFEQNDVDKFEQQKRIMQKKTTFTYLGMCAVFSGFYVLKYGLKRKSSLWSHGVKLFAVGFILPAIPAKMVSTRLCANDQARLLEIADKYPISDERLFRDFIAYALPGLKDKFYEELDKKKKEYS